MSDKNTRLRVKKHRGGITITGIDKEGNDLITVEGATIGDAMKKLSNEAFEKYREHKHSNHKLATQYMRIHVEALVSWGKTS